MPSNDPEYRAAYEREVRAAIERLDVLEPPTPRKGCNAHDEHGNRCGRLVVSVKAGPLSMRRLCEEHERLYLEHDRILARIAVI